MSAQVIDLAEIKRRRIIAQYAKFYGGGVAK